MKEREMGKRSVVSVQMLLSALQIGVSNSILRNTPKRTMFIKMFRDGILTLLDLFSRMSSVRFKKPFRGVEGHCPETYRRKSVEPSTGSFWRR